MSILRYWAVEEYARAEDRVLFTPLQTTDQRGTEPEPIAALLNGCGLVADYRYGTVTIADLERAVDRREPPIVDLQAWRDDETPWRDTWNAGHYVTLVAYDADYFYFADPSTVARGGYAFLPRGELEERWHDLAGANDAPVQRMAIFIRGARRWTPSVPAPRTVVRLA